MCPMQAPTWMFSHYLHAQIADGMWDQPGSVPRSVVAHAVFALDTVTKATILKMHRWWQWDQLPSAPQASAEHAAATASHDCALDHDTAL